MWGLKTGGVIPEWPSTDTGAKSCGGNPESRRGDPGMAVPQRVRPRDSRG